MVKTQKYNKKYELYFEGLNKSKNNSSDNFFKQSRHLDLMTLAEIVLRDKITGDFVETGCWKGHSSYFLSKLISKERGMPFFNRVLLHIIHFFS